MYLVSSGFSFKPTSSCSSSSSSTQFSQEWARRKVVVKHSIKSNHCYTRLLVYIYISHIFAQPFKHYYLRFASPDGWAVWGVVMSTRWWLLVDHCVLRNWDRILVRAVKGLIFRAGMVSICPLLWQRDVKLQQTKPNQTILDSCYSSFTK